MTTKNVSMHYQMSPEDENCLQVRKLLWMTLQITSVCKQIPNTRVGLGPENEDLRKTTEQSLQGRSSILLEITYRLWVRPQFLAFNELIPEKSNWNSPLLEFQIAFKFLSPGALKSNALQFVNVPLSFKIQASWITASLIFKCPQL